MKNIKEKIANLSAEKRALLELKLKNKNTNTPKYQRIPQRRNHDSVPLSFAQERLWFLDQLEPNKPFYNIPGAFLLQGNLNLQVLQQTLSEILRRHEILRTSFQTVDGTPVQVIQPKATIEITVVDLQELPDTELETILHQKIQQEAITPFDLEEAPLIRCLLLQLDATSNVLLLTMHHIISDGWSIGVFINELSILYQAFSQGESISCVDATGFTRLAELPIQYADFAVWQRNWLSGEVLQNQLNYWKQQLHGAPELLQLPTDHPRPNLQTYRGTNQNFTLNTDLTQKLQTLSRESSSTLFMILQAAFATLLYRYSGQSDILIGSPITNRNRSELESLIGFFVNTLVLRSCFEDNPSFESLLAQVRETTLEAYENQDVPFEQVVEALRPKRSLSYPPLFQVMFVLNNTPARKIELPGVTLSELDFQSTISKFDLTLVISESDQGLLGSWEYNTDLFDGSTIKRMAGHFQNLLSAIVENPQQSVNELPLLSEAQRNQLLVGWNDTAREYPTDKCIHQLFEEQVEKTPDALAVVFDTEKVTYQELNQRANQLAHHLKNLGVGTEVLVGICVERSIEMVVGLLGILKAGGAYVPFDPNYPQERLSYMLADSGVEVLLTQRSLLESLPQNQATVVCLDTDWGTIEQQSQDNLDVGIYSDSLAYVIYTSGSTGKPKGVMNTHQGIHNRLRWMQDAYQLTSSDRIVQKTPFSFDVSVWEFFWALLTGARIVVAKPEGHKDSNYLVNLISQQQITTIHFVPSMLQVFLQEPDLKKCSCLKRVFCSGEALPFELTQRFFSKLECELHNLYGPTEAAIDVTFWQCQPQENLQIVPIGRPIANTQIYILDSCLKPVPIGVAGELYIGGDGLARGYLNRPELTNEKFIQNPLCDSKSERLYKTGDLARYLSDGNIEFLGRIDHQVKVRGFRIEPGEIEAVLNTHPQIQQVLVIAREDIPGNKRLVAYIVASDKLLTTNELREFIKQKLPEYMVPSVFVTLDTLPLTPNGKVDRKALPAPDGDITREDENEYVAPRTQIEQTLTNIWQQLLLKEKISIHDNFFEIGGDSILSIQVVSRAKNSGIQITPKQIFQNQTIAQLAKVANTTVSPQCQQGIVTGSAPLTPIQHLFFAQNRQQPHHFNQSVLLDIPRDIKPQFLEKAVEKLVEHHDVLRLRFSCQGSKHKQINQGLDDTVPFKVVDLSSTPKLEQAQALEEIATEYQGSLNLSDGPIMQVVMFNLGSESNARLLIIIHHLAVDGVSWRILLSDLETIYQQLIVQQPIQLGEKTTAFIDWAEKLNNYAQSEILKQELDYWLNQPWSKTTPLPFDYAHTQQANTVTSTITYRAKLSVEETRLLLGSVNEAYNTQINDILLSTLVIALAQWMGNSTFSIDLEGHGREELFESVDLSRTVGWFTSLFPVLLQLPTDDQPGSVIKSIKEQLRAIPNRGIGYGILRYLCEDTTVNQQLITIPTPEICFNYLGQFDQVQSQTDWKLAPESTGKTRSSKQTRDHLLDINALVVEGELQIDWTYSSNIHNQATVENLAQSYLQAIRSIIKHCESEDNTGYTPSDFPLAQLNQLELDDLLTASKTKNIESIYPLSPMQQGMLFHSLYAPDSGVYFGQMTLNLQGNVNIAAFEAAWQKVVDRHSVLRTFFVWENRQTPLQVVLKQVNLPWNNLDWQELSPEEQQQQLSQLLQKQREQGFQFNQAPLMGCTLIRLTQDTYKFIWSNHHILTDGWCLPIIFEEVLSFYEAELGSETCYLPTPRPYSDYIAWLHNQDNEAAIEFWQQNLQDFRAPTPLIVDKPNFQKQQSQSDYQKLELHLSQKMSRKLKDIAQQNHVTLSTIVQAAWGLLLSRYSGEQDVVFGVTVSGRPASLSGVENMVGLFINTLPLRVQISPQQQIIPWLEQIQQLMLELQHYSYTPLVDIQTISEIPGGITLFESIVVFENYPVDTSLLNEGGLLQPSEMEGFEQTNYPLTVSAVPGDELLVKISYGTLRFTKDTIERMLGHLQTIFSAIAENPAQQVGELPLLSEAERHQLLTQWNDTECVYPQDKCIHQLFEQQVEKTPDAIAVVFDTEELTYQQLNCMANQLAHHLQTIGVGPEVLVGICVERSIEMVVGLLGILKAGGAYVPFDPNYPQERLSYMLADSGVEVLLTQRSLLESLPQNQATVVCLDTDWGTIEQQSQDNLDVGIYSDSLAYVIYTSGSTGKPKGVMNTHQGIHNRLRWMQDAYQLTSSDRIVQKTPFSFDVSVWEFFWALLTGARIVVAKPEGHKDSNYLVNLISQQQITTIHFVPSMLQVFLQEPDLKKCSCLKRVFCSGEALPFELTQRFFSKLECELHNLYGPTEAAIDVTFWQCQPQENLQIVPIGRPIANTQIYILDSCLKPVPIGVAGELYIGGDGLARGYLNRPELTNEKFIQNPFSDCKSQRLYKTGDLARYRNDGNIEFLGRMDHQVKVRGFRIEPGEIESVLNTHPQIQQVLVIAREDIPGNKHLVAYIVVSDELLVTNQLRKFIQQKLPQYMVPSAFVTLDTLPLTPNGKVDRKALPAPDGEIIREHEYFPPRTQSEEIIANIFSSILSVHNVGVYDDFFELGGHSLLATQVTSRLKQTFCVQLSLRQMFETPTVAGLAEAVTQLQLQDTEDEDIAHLLAELEGLSDEEVQQLLVECN